MMCLFLFNVMLLLGTVITLLIFLPPPVQH